jgi:hypothetical protein
MALRRYSRTTKIRGGKMYGTSRGAVIIRQRVLSGKIATQRYTLKEAERLDILAGKYYGNARLWWAIAAASGIGWGLQAPAGTVIFIPRLGDVAQVVG